MKELLLILLSYLTALAQSDTRAIPGTPSFDISFGFFPTNDPAKTDVEIYFSIPKEGLQFVITDSGYTARFSLFSAIFKAKQMICKLEQASFFTVKTYAKTKSEGNVPGVLRLREIPVGVFDLTIKVTDFETRTEYSKKAKLNVPKFPRDNRPHFSSLVIFAWEPPAPFFGKFYPDSDSVRYKFALVTPLTKSGSLVFGIADKESIFSIDTIAFESGGAIINIEHTSSIPARKSQFNIFAKASTKDGTEEIIKKEIFLKTVFSERASDPEEIIEQLELLGNRDEIRKLERAKNDPDSFANAYRSFWQTRDPTPATEQNEVEEEFYRRIRIANERYGNREKGWRTDMGKVFIVHGEPDEIERHPFDINRRAYEIWYYYEGRRIFYFVDRIGDGTYQLYRQE